MTANRIDRQGRVLHYLGSNVVSIGRPDQCHYNGCKRIQASGSHLCLRHLR